jgi:hypothetical protein
MSLILTSLRCPAVGASGGSIFTKMKGPIA